MLESQMFRSTVLRNWKEKEQLNELRAKDEENNKIEYLHNISINSEDADQLETRSTGKFEKNM